MDRQPTVLWRMRVSDRERERRGDFHKMEKTLTELSGRPISQLKIVDLEPFTPPVMENCNMRHLSTLEFSLKDTVFKEA